MNNPGAAFNNAGRQLGGFLNNNPFANPSVGINKPPMNQGQMVPWNQGSNQLSQAGNQFPDFMNPITTQNFGQKMDTFLMEADICDDSNICDTYLIPAFKHRGAVRGMQDDMMENPAQGAYDQAPGSNGVEANYMVAGSANGNSPLQFQGLASNPDFDLSPDRKSMNIRRPGLYTIRVRAAQIPAQFRNSASLVIADGAGHKFPAKLVGDQLVVSVPVSQSEIGTAAARLSPSIIANRPLTSFSGNLRLYKSQLPVA